MFFSGAAKLLSHDPTWRNLTALSFHYETQLGHSNYGASKLAADHARSANVNTSNNVVSMKATGRPGGWADIIIWDGQQ